MNENELKEKILKTIEKNKLFTKKIINIKLHQSKLNKQFFDCYLFYSDNNKDYYYILVDVNKNEFFSIIHGKKIKLEVEKWNFISLTKLHI